jgi:hypothetical protein
MKQYAKNACGSIAVFHSILNNMDLKLVSKDGIMQKFYDETIKL